MAWLLLMTRSSQEDLQFVYRCQSWRISIYYFATLTSLFPILQLTAGIFHWVNIIVSQYLLQCTKDVSALIAQIGRLVHYTTPQFLRHSVLPETLLFFLRSPYLHYKDGFGWTNHVESDTRRSVFTIYCVILYHQNNDLFPVRLHYRFSVPGFNDLPTVFLMINDLNENYLVCILDTVSRIKNDAKASTTISGWINFIKYKIPIIKNTSGNK